MAFQVTNNAVSTLASGVTNVATSMTVASGQGALFPTPAGGDTFRATLVRASDGAIEIVNVTARATDTMTVTRAQEGTTELTLVTGDKFELRLTAAVVNTFVVPDKATTFTQTQNFAASGFTLKGSSSGLTTFASANASATGYTITFPEITDTVATLTATQTLTNKTWNGVVIAGQYGGTGVDNTGKTITLGGNLTFTGASNISFTTVGGYTYTLPNGTSTLATTGLAETLQTKTLVAPVINGTPATTAGMHGYDTTWNVPTFYNGSAVRRMGYLNVPLVSASANTTVTKAHAGGGLKHPSADTTARTFTIDSNANQSWEDGTALTFLNQNAAGVVTIGITTDTMRLAGAGTTGSRTLAANGLATAIWDAATTTWYISGTNLT